MSQLRNWKRRNAGFSDSTKERELRAQGLSNKQVAKALLTERVVELKKMEEVFRKNEFSVPDAATLERALGIGKAKLGEVLRTVREIRNFRNLDRPITDEEWLAARQQITRKEKARAEEIEKKVKF